MTHVLSHRNYERKSRSRVGRVMRNFDLADYELHLHYMRQDKMSHDDAAWKVARLNWEWKLCGWAASRLEREGDLESANEARKLREFFGREKQTPVCPCGCKDPECHCRELARFRFREAKDEYWKSSPRYAADTKPEDWVEPYTAEAFSENFLHKAIPDLDAIRKMAQAEMSRK